jgi:hypothetical protein
MASPEINIPVDVAETLGDPTASANGPKRLPIEFELV